MTSLYKQLNPVSIAIWKIAFIDGVVDMHEEYLVRKIADLLHVPHTAFIIQRTE